MTYSSLLLTLRVSGFIKNVIYLLLTVSMDSYSLTLSLSLLLFTTPRIHFRVDVVPIALPLYLLMSQCTFDCLGSGDWVRRDWWLFLSKFCLNTTGARTSPGVNRFGNQISGKIII